MESSINIFSTIDPGGSYISIICPAAAYPKKIVQFNMADHMILVIAVFFSCSIAIMPYQMLLVTRCNIVIQYIIIVNR
jgi:hypothetical protein